MSSTMASGRQLERRRQHRRPVVHALRVVPPRPQDERDALAGVHVVVHHQHAARPITRGDLGLLAAPRRPGRRGAGASGSRTENSLPCPGPALYALTRAAVQLHQPLAPASARCPARPASAPASGRPARTGRRCAAACPAAMPTPVSRTASRPVVLRARPSRLMLPGRAGVLGRVGEQVGDHLRQPHQVGLTQTGSSGSMHLQPVAARVERRLGGLHRRAAPRSRGRSRSRPQLDLPAHDARHVEQVVHQPHQMAAAAAPSCARACSAPPGSASGIFSRCSALRIGASGLRSSWRQHRQELVLLPVGLAELLDALAQLALQPLALGDVAHDAGEVAPLADVELADRQLHREGRAVLAPPDHLAADADDAGLGRCAGSCRCSGRARCGRARASGPSRSAR